MGTIETIALLREAGILLRFITHTTAKTTVQFHKNYPNEAEFLAIPEILTSQFSKVKQTIESPSFVVLGDLVEAFDYHILNQVF